MKKTLLISSLFLALTSWVWAQDKPKSTEPEPETQVLSDSLTYDDLNKTSVFTGNVILTRGLMRLTADSLHLKEEANGDRHGSALADEHKKVHILQENPATYEVIKAEGERVDYSDKSEVLTLSGDAFVTRYICGHAVDHVRGQKIIYNSKSKTYAAVGQNDQVTQGRVRSLIQPRERMDQATQECQLKYKGKPMPSTIQPKQTNTTGNA